MNPKGSNRLRASRTALFSTPYSDSSRWSHSLTLLAFDFNFASACWFAEFAVSTSSHISDNLFASLCERTEDAVTATAVPMPGRMR